MASSEQSHPKHNANRLLAGLSARDQEQLLACCTLVSLKVGAVLAIAGQPQPQVYFPIDCTICLTTPTDANNPLGIYLIGREGMLGSTLSTGQATLQVQATVQVSGDAWRISRNKFVQQLVLLPLLQKRVSSYLHVTLDYLIRNAACCQFHLLEARLAYWLLMVHDRVDADEFELTQKALADLLGVRRVGITLAARAMQARGLISYRRGLITILDRPGIAVAACTCYGVAEAAYDQLLS